MPVDPHRPVSDFEQLRSLTADEHGAQRIAWTPTWLKARAWFQSKLAQLPVEHHLDAAGNSWTTLRGCSEQALILGSHLDSVPNGGWLDGALGVLAGFEVLRRFGRGLPGQAAGHDSPGGLGRRGGRALRPQSLRLLCLRRHAHHRGRPRPYRSRWQFAWRMRYANVRSMLTASVTPARERAHAGAYLELHIEQGPVLESMQLPLGVVLGTKGVERHAITFHGQEAHSGSTPMAVRRDALAAAAKLALEIRPIARKHPDAVATMGSVKTFPGIVTAVVGRCETTLDMRDLDAGALALMLAEAKEASRRFAAEEGCARTVEWSKIWSIEPIPFDPRLIALCDQAVVETAGKSHQLPSGPLHDAAEVARAGIPVVMMFTQSLNGLSHNPAENTRTEHLELAVQAYDRLARKALHLLTA